MNIEILNYQNEFLTAKEKNVALLCGIGAGKSFILAHGMVKTIAEYPNINILLVANTYTQLINATVTALIEVLEDLGIPYHAVLGGSRKYIKIGKSTIYLYSLEKYNNIRGINVGAIFADEFAYSKEEAFNVIKGRLRQKGMPLIFRGVTSPNGFNWVHKLWSGSNLIGKSQKKNNYLVIYGKTCDNYFLPIGYFDELLELYGGKDSLLARQELYGEFVNLLAGAIYWSFRRERHVRKVDLVPEAPIYISTDFNIGNMNAVMCQQIGNNFRVLKEICLTDYDSNTFCLAERLLKETKNFRKVYIIPDSTGRARKTSSSYTDLDILKNAGFTVLDTYNPLKKDRINNVNAKLMRDNLTIDPSCENLIQEIETFCEFDKEGDEVHLSVCVGYVLHKLSPLIKRHGSRVYDL